MLRPGFEPGFPPVFTVNESRARNAGPSYTTGASLLIYNRFFIIKLLLKKAENKHLKIYLNFFEYMPLGRDLRQERIMKLLQNQKIKKKI